MKVVRIVENGIPKTKDVVDHQTPEGEVLSILPLLDAVAWIGAVFTLGTCLANFFCNFTENEAAGVVLKWLPLKVYTFPCAAGPAVVCQKEQAEKLLDLIEQNPQFWHFFETATGKRPGSWS